MMKRLIDILVSLCLLILCFPIIAASLFLVLLITGENPVFLQERKISLEKNGFKVIKIRTIKSSDEFKKLEESHKEIFVKTDYEKFVPKFCKWLRKTGLDEILQVINVLKGEMSLVGPRPLPENELILMQMSEPGYYKRRTKINSKPGVTGYWQAFGDRLLGAENLINFDEKYEKEKSFLLDLKIISKTIIISLSASHSDAIIKEKNKQAQKFISIRNFHIVNDPESLDNTQVLKSPK